MKDDSAIVGRGYSVEVMKDDTLYGEDTVLKGWRMIHYSRERIQCWRDEGWINYSRERIQRGRYEGWYTIWKRYSVEGMKDESAIVWRGYSV